MKLWKRQRNYKHQTNKNKDIDCNVFEDSDELKCAIFTIDKEYKI